MVPKGLPTTTFAEFNIMNTEFDETRMEEELANARVELPPGDLERIVVGTPNVVWDTLAFCARDKLITAVERIWAGCQECIEDGEADLAIELGQALVYGLRRRSEREQMGGEELAQRNGVEREH